MLSDIEINMMVKFLRRNYPVKRVKNNTRFKRAIILDDGSQYILSDDSQVLLLKYKLMELLLLIFNSDEQSNKYVITTYLNN